MTGPRATRCEWLPFLAEQVGAKKPMKVPRFVGRLLAGEAAVVLMTEIRGASNAKAKRATVAAVRVVQVAVARRWARSSGAKGSPDTAARHSRSASA